MNEKSFKLSDTGRTTLTLALLREDRLVPPPTLPVAAARQVVRSLIAGGLLEEVPAPSDEAEVFWRAAEDGTRVALRATEAGVAAVAPDNASCEGHQAATEAEPAPCAAPSPQPAQEPEAVIQIGRRLGSVRQAARALVEAWDAASGTPAADRLQQLIEHLRTALRSGSRQPRRPSQSRRGTKQEAVLAMLRRPEGATVAQIAGEMDWAPHTVRGFFVGIKKRRGIAVTAVERVRQAGPTKEGAKGNYTIYRIVEAG
ncbi:MAG: DUF3489 domain-containing protein [Acetobacteraceae bacterium]